MRSRLRVLGEHGSSEAKELIYDMTCCFRPPRSAAMVKAGLHLAYPVLWPNPTEAGQP